MLENKNNCPRCQSARLKTWEELTSDEKFVMERLSINREDSTENRRNNLFCSLCGFETRPFEEKA
jgi:hypothetical protein